MNLILTPVIVNQLKSYIYSLAGDKKVFMASLLDIKARRCGEYNYLNFDYDRYVIHSLHKLEIDKSYPLYEDIVTNVHTHLLGFYGNMDHKAKSVVDNWINTAEKFWRTKEGDAPYFIKFYASAIYRAARRQVRDTTLESECSVNTNRRCVQFTSIDKEVRISKESKKTLHEIVAGEPTDFHADPDRGRRFLRTLIQLFGRDTVTGEALDLFLNGISRKEMLAYITKFGVNNKGGSHSLDKDLIVKITEKNDRGRAMSPAEAKVTDKNSIAIEIVPKWEKLSPQMFQFYLDRLKTFMHDLWNNLEALDETEYVDIKNQAGAQFLNWNVTNVNTH